MTRCKLLVPAAICTVLELVGGAGVVSAYTGEELAKYAKNLSENAQASLRTMRCIIAILIQASLVRGLIS
jgi:phage-related minor tail protein